MSKIALITGINGMDGSHLADLLLSKDYTVFGTVRSNSNLSNIQHILDKINILQGDVSNIDFVYKSILASKPDEIYHLAALSFNSEIWQNTINTYEIDGMSTVYYLEAIRNINPNIKFLFSSSSEIFGEQNGSLDESNTPMPNTPYGLAKYFSQENIKIYRKNHNIFACSAICFNHESERRSEKFVTRKISKNVADIYLKSSSKITLGNIDARKDWGYAPEFVEAMHLMLQSSKPQDYVLSTYKLYSVKDILISAFQNVGILDWQNYVVYDESLANNRIAKENYGNYDKINQDLGWKPKTFILDVINKMVQYDIENTKINKKIFLLQ